MGPAGTRQRPIVAPAGSDRLGSKDWHFFQSRGLFYGYITENQRIFAQGTAIRHETYSTMLLISFTAAFCGLSSMSSVPSIRQMQMQCSHLRFTGSHICFGVIKASGRGAAKSHHRLCGHAQVLCFKAAFARHALKYLFRTRQLDIAALKIIAPADHCSRQKNQQREHRRDRHVKRVMCPQLAQ